MRDYMDRWDTPPKQIFSPTWGPPPPCKQFLISPLPVFTYPDVITKFSLIDRFPISIAVEASLLVFSSFF